MLNFCWSRWIKIFSRSNPYPTTGTYVTLIFCHFFYVYIFSFLFHFSLFIFIFSLSLIFYFIFYFLLFSFSFPHFFLPIFSSLLFSLSQFLIFFRFHFLIFIYFFFAEKLIEVTLMSMELVYQKSDLQFPPLGLTFTMREHFIRISCPILLSNRSG